MIRAKIAAVLLALASLPPTFAHAQLEPTRDESASTTSAPLRLSLSAAVTQALRANLTAIEGETRIGEATGTAERRRALLLPKISASHTTSLQNRNLKAFGMSLPGAFSALLPTVVGPFSTYDYRLSASQTILDRQATHALRAAERQVDSEKLTWQDTRELIVRQTEARYRAAQTNQATWQAAEARLTTSQSLTQLAVDQKANGLATGIDVLRAEVQQRRAEQNVLVARNAYETARLDLTRYLGLRPGTEIELAERLAMTVAPVPEASTAVRTALAARHDYAALQMQRTMLDEQSKAARARDWPRLFVDGNYGAQGRSYGQMPGIGQIEGTLAITVFDRDRQGERREIAARRARLAAQIADLERAVEQDVRQALLDLQSTAQQAEVTEAEVALARQELALASDRFRHGVADNLEVVRAQGELQAAEDDAIAALARHEDARMALARAIGQAEQSVNDEDHHSPSTDNQTKETK